MEESGGSGSKGERRGEGRDGPDEDNRDVAMMVERKNSRVDCDLDRRTKYIGSDRWTKWADGGGPNNGASRGCVNLP